MRNMNIIVAKLNSMTEAERIEYIRRELTLEEVFALYDEYGYATEIGNGTVQASYLEANQRSNIA